MKRRMFVLFLCLALSVVGIGGVGANISASANSAAPTRPDSNSGIVFKQHDSVRITREVLDIELDGNVAKVSASYTMNNMSDNALNVETMFLSPVVPGETEQNFEVSKNDKPITYTQDYFGETYGSHTTIETWEAVLAAYRTRTKPFGEGTGFKVYELVNTNSNIHVDQNTTHYENRVELGLKCSDYFFSNIKASFVSSEETKYEFYDRAYIITRGQIEITKYMGDYSMTTTEIADIYDYLYNLGLPEENASKFASQQFNKYLADIIVQEHLNGKPIELFQAQYDENYYISAVTYFVDFAPHETLNLTVKYNTKLIQSRGNKAEFVYYLTPARYWKSFSDLTINLTLDKDRDILMNSNLSFTKESDLKYKFTSRVLPKSELRITVSDKVFLGCDVGCGIAFVAFIIFVLPIGCLLIIVFGIKSYNKKKRKKDQQEQQATKATQDQKDIQDLQDQKDLQEPKGTQDQNENIDTDKK